MKKTCKGCREFLDIDRFYMRNIGIPYTLCKNCYNKDRKERDLNRQHEGEFKECNACHEFLYKDQFSKNRSGKLGRCETCKNCVYLDGLRVKYGIEDIDSLIAKQDGKCLVCLGLFKDVSAHKKPAVDHNHKCCPGTKTCGKCVRGLLCHRCNQGLGYFNDDIGLMKKAIAYLGSYE